MLHVRDKADSKVIVVATSRGKITLMCVDCIASIVMSAMDATDDIVRGLLQRQFMARQGSQAVAALVSDSEQTVRDVRGAGSTDDRVPRSVD